MNRDRTRHPALGIVTVAVAAALTISVAGSSLAAAQQDSNTAKAEITQADSGDFLGRVRFEQVGDGPVTITGRLAGLAPGLHGFHIHRVGKTSNKCLDAGPHYNPENMQHGGPLDHTNRHAGDLGNILADDSGFAEFEIDTSAVSLTGRTNIVGRSLIVDVGEDDLGRGDVPESKTTGNSGGRYGCGVIVDN